MANRSRCSIEEPFWQIPTRKRSGTQSWARSIAHGQSVICYLSFVIPFGVRRRAPARMTDDKWQIGAGAPSKSRSGKYQHESDPAPSHGRDQSHTANLSSAICHLSYHSATAEWSAVPALEHFFALECFSR